MEPEVAEMEGYLDNQGWNDVKAQGCIKALRMVCYVEPFCKL